MAGKRVYISRSPEDAVLGDQIAAALDAWEVSYTAMAQPLGANEQLTEAAKQTLRTCEVFLRLCTAQTARSQSMYQEVLFFNSLQAEDRRQHDVEHRILVNLILDAAYVREPFDNVTLFIDTANKTRAFWLDELARPLGVATTAQRLARISRRSAITLGVAGLITAASGTAAGVLFVQNRDQANAATDPNKPLGPATAISGQEAWSVQVSLKIDKSQTHYTGQTVSVASTGSRIYAMSQDTLLALDAAQQPLWHTSTSLDTSDYDYSYPVFANTDIVAFVSDEYDASKQQSSYVNLLDAHTHTLRWRVQVDVAPNFTEVGPINVVGTTLYLFASISNIIGVYAFDIHTGKQLWYTSTGSGTPYPQVVYLDGRLYVGEPFHFNCLNAHDGKSIWDVSLSTIALTAAAADGMVYFGGLDGYIYGLDARSGKIRWRYQVNAPITAQPLAVNGAVYIGDSSGYLWAFNGQTGDLYWKGFAGDDAPGAVVDPGSQEAAITAQPVINRNVVAILAGNILATYDVRTGQLRWKYVVKQSDTRQYEAMGPVIFNDLFIVGSNENHVTAINP